MLGLVLLFCFRFVMPQYLNNYQAALIDKNERLCSIDGPKIVLVGNSNLAFGIDSRALEEAFGMPVVNMGMHGGLGNAFNEQAAVQNVCKGDIVILSYSNFDDGDVRHQSRTIKHIIAVLIKLKPAVRIPTVHIADSLAPKYNTYMHLNNEGVGIRTALLIEDLKNYLDKNNE